MNETLKNLYTRTSVRVFEDKEISQADKTTILECALQAPSAGNLEMYTILNITDEALLSKLALSCDDQPFIAKSKFALIFCADYQKWIDAFAMIDDNVRVPGPAELFLGMNDALIAAQNAVVAAQSLGIGSCYIGDIMEKEAYHRELLHLPQYVFPVTMIVFGYPTAQQLQRAKPPRYALQYMVHENGYQQMDTNKLKEMFQDQQSRGPLKNFDCDAWLKALYERKYNTEFSIEMSHSINNYLDKFNLDVYKHKK